MATVSVRYIVDDVDAAIAFYCGHLGFDGEDAPRADVRDAHPRRSAPRAERTERRRRRRSGDARRDETRARRLEPLHARNARSRDDGRRRSATAGVHFRNDIVTGVGGKQILLDDPCGNPIELFEPTRPEASLTAP